jgi:hypothetical protein
LDVEFIHKPRQNNVVLDALSKKEEFQLENPQPKPRHKRPSSRAKATWNER